MASEQEAALLCWNCGASLTTLPRPITRHMNCPACFEDLHCCRLCRNYLPNATPPCADDRADVPVNKEVANFCEFFRPSAHACEPASTARQARAKADLDALFASGEASEEADVSRESIGDGDETRRKLDDLFR